MTSSLNVQSGLICSVAGFLRHGTAIDKKGKAIKYRFFFLRLLT